MFGCSRVVALLLAKFGKGDVTNGTCQERTMTEAFESVLLEAAHYDMRIEDEEDLEEGNDEKMDVDPDLNRENIETSSSPSTAPSIEFGGKPMLLGEVFWSNFLQILANRMMINQEID
ncbi:hypothetical protein Y032_0003g1661 [Ancylostoma ceylanicum]|uniref:Uncharacterized protein n=1 Tax=Ancylostoma ceylanicum TaxID=53326 RepID=A0A016W0R7_9BILA|nr:hypothetical protein Y032_0003g1661 [Ancylostoma ceylanicum]